MKIKVILVMSLISIAGFSQTKDSLKYRVADSTTKKVFQLGEVTIAVKKNDELINRISVANMEKENRMEASKALQMLPGINLTASGARNESMVNVRGFDLRAVPVYMDGIPVYVPYDGYVDLARFTTFDLSAIDVSKGFSSVLYGPNSLGGAINLISRKPIKKYEFDGSLGMINTNGYKGNINLGFNFGQFYIQGGASYLHRDSYRMSAHYKPTKNEDGKNRDNSYRTDQKYTLKIGWTPNKNHEYVLGYIHQRGEKGTPVYCGEDELNSMYFKPRYWQWPSWNKETYYFLSKTAINSKNYIKTKLYYDVFKNEINSFDDDAYTTQNKGYAFQSFYNDYTYGATVEYGTRIIPKNDIKLAMHFKEDVHRENNLNEPVSHFNDYTITIGLEDIYKITEKIIVIPGLSYSARENTRAQDYNSSTKIMSNFSKAKTSHAYNGQLGVFYYIKDNHKIGATISIKTRFSTIKDRYSYKMGKAIPNPNLKPETATNYELNYVGRLIKKITIQAALFYSNLDNAILNVSNVQPGKSQMQNTGKAEFMGIEAGVKYDILNNLLLGINYTYIKRNNLTNPTDRYTDVPNSKVFGFIQYQPIKQIQLMLSTEFNSSRYSTSYGVTTPDFTLVNFSISGKVWKYISIETGINNILDKNYALVEGYPEEGRNFFVTLRFFNHD